MIVFISIYAFLCIIYVNVMQPELVQYFIINGNLIKANYYSRRYGVSSFVHIEPWMCLDLFKCVTSCGFYVQNFFYEISGIF